MLTTTTAAVRALAVLALLTLVAGCQSLQRGEVSAWYASAGAIMPREGGRVVVCHGFGCHRKTAFSFSAADLATMAALIGRARTAQAERAGVRRMVAWAEERVAAKVGSADDVGGLDLRNAGRAGQMDCIDEAANTTSYLLVAQSAGLLRKHRVSRPVARGYFLDGRYPHATAVLLEGNTAWAINSWPHANGVPPDVMPLSRWYERSSAR